MRVAWVCGDLGGIILVGFVDWLLIAEALEDSYNELQ